MWCCVSDLNDTAQAFLNKATGYVGRGVDQPADSEQYAYWLHFAVEPLLRAAVAKVHPVLLADPRSDASILVALGVRVAADTATRSRVASSLVKLLGVIDAQRFGPDFATRVDRFIDRRNVEAHGDVAAMAGVAGGWRDEFLRLATTLCEFIGVPLQQVLGHGLATVAAQLTERDERAVKAELERLLKLARARMIGTVPATGFEETQFASGMVVRAFACPVCDNEAYVTGWAISESGPLVDAGVLVRRVTVASRSFRCEHCELTLADRPLLVAAGLPDVFETSSHVDPYEALTLDPTEEVERMGLHVVDPAWEPEMDDQYD
jgi:hypothetical protein